VDDSLGPREIQGDVHNQLLTLYDRRVISRRDLLGALAVLGASAAVGAAHGAAAQTVAAPTAATQGRTLNHVSLGVTELQRSTAFYDRLLHLPVRDRDPRFCEYRLENGFLGLYQEPGMRRGLDHVAIGMDGYDAKATLQALLRAFPGSSAELRNDDQVYITDPDGARIQLCAVAYKR
jgi:catechol 2,3-dioxygenase-like lactoylglutathione lyase family enzyme